MASEKLGICDEGGEHDFRRPKQVGCCDYFLCFLCWPVYAICSCMLSDGAALANPLFEQVCCGKSASSDASSEPSCSKCGLTRREATDLTAARSAEGGRGYFTNAMKYPAAEGAAPRQSMPEAPVEVRRSMVRDRA